MARDSGFVFLVLKLLFAMCGMPRDQSEPRRDLASLQQRREQRCLTAQVNNRQGLEKTGVTSGSSGSKTHTDPE